MLLVNLNLTTPINKKCILVSLKASNPDYLKEIQQQKETGVESLGSLFGEMDYLIDRNEVRHGTQEEIKNAKLEKPLSNPPGLPGMHLNCLVQLNSTRGLCDGMW